MKSEHGISAEHRADHAADPVVGHERPVGGHVQHAGDGPLPAADEEHRDDVDRHASHKGGAATPEPRRAPQGDPGPVLDHLERAVPVVGPRRARTAARISGEKRYRSERSVLTNDPSTAPRISPPPNPSSSPHPCLRSRTGRST